MSYDKKIKKLCQKISCNSKDIEKNLQNIKSSEIVVRQIKHSLNDVTKEVDRIKEKLSFPSLTIVHFGDVYRFSPDMDSNFGGMAGISTLVKNIRENNENVLLCFSGDFARSSEPIFTRGSHIIEMFNEMNVDLIALGNHEFDYGVENARKLINTSTSKWLISNVFEEDGKTPFNNGIRNYIIEKDGFKFGFIGLLYRKTKNVTTTEKLVIDDVVDIAKKEVKDLIEQGADIIIAMTHQNFRDDKKLAKEVPEINLILGAHEHVVATETVGNTYILRSSDNGGTICVTNIIPQKERIIKLPPKINISFERNYYGIPQEAKILQIVDKAQKEKISKLDEVIAQVKTPFDTEKVDVRRNETIIGNIITDAFKEYTNADIGLMPGGLIKGNREYKVGPFTNKDALEILPFGYNVFKIEITGKTLKEMLEYSVFHYPEKKGRFLQVSGIELVFSESKPSGNRVESIKVNGEVLDENKKYTTATSEYVARGGEGYRFLPDEEIIINDKEAMTDLDVFIEYIKKNNIDGKIERRIVVN